MRQTKIGLRLLAKIHSSACGTGTSRVVAWIIRSKISGTSRNNRKSPFYKLLHEHWKLLSPDPSTQKFFDDPKKMLRSMAIVLKSSSANEKGVMCIL
jgi:hypothetical protein